MSRAYQASPQVKPMRTRHLALGNRDKTGQSSFRGKEVVITGIKTTFLNTVAKREQMTFFIIKKTKIHFVKQAIYLFNNIFQALHKYFCLLLGFPYYCYSRVRLCRCRNTYRRRIKLGQALRITAGKLNKRRIQSQLLPKYCRLRSHKQCFLTTV